jgi:hypothetical protein
MLLLKDRPRLCVYQDLVSGGMQGSKGRSLEVLIVSSKDGGAEALLM